jgi:hypothetical protein
VSGAWTLPVKAHNISGLIPADTHFDDSAHELVSIHQVRFRPASGTQQPASHGSKLTELWSDAWKDGGRATFRPATSERGRPSYKHDAEDLYSQIVSLKSQLKLSGKEHEKLQVKVAKIEAKCREKDKIVVQALLEKGHELPSRMRALVEDCLRSESEAEKEHLKSEIKRKDEEIRALHLRFGSGENAYSNVDDHLKRAQFEKSKGKPWEIDADGSLDSPASSGRQSTGRKTIFSAGSGKQSNDSALQAARVEIDRLQKLYTAGEIVRSSLESRVSELENEVNRLRKRASADPESPTKQGAPSGGEGEGEEHKDETLFIKDDRAFENHIRKLAGLAELPSAEKPDRASQRVRIGMNPKASALDTGKTLAASSQGGKKTSREWAFYEACCPPIPMLSLFIQLTRTMCMYTRAQTQTQAQTHAHTHRATYTTIPLCSYMNMEITTLAEQ